MGILIPFLYSGPDKPRLLSQTTNSLVVSFTNLNDSHWKYLYDASALGQDNRTYKGACDIASNTCIFGGISPCTQFNITIQAFIPSVETLPPVGSEASEPLIAFTLTEG